MGLLGTGAQDGHLDFHTDSGLYVTVTVALYVIATVALYVIVTVAFMRLLLSPFM